MGENPQILDRRGRVPRGNACLGLSSEVLADGVSGLVIGLASRGDDGAFPPGEPDDLMLAVAWGAGPDGADISDLIVGNAPHTWVPAEGLVRTTAYVPGGA